LQDARRHGFQYALPTEKSGQHEFDFQYGDQFARHIEAFDPKFTKVLVRYNPEGDDIGNRRQAARLKRISDYLNIHDRLFMFELLVPAEPAQLAQVGGDKKAYDLKLRPGLMVGAIHQLQDAGIEPDIWKIEGLDRREDCVTVVEAARREGREQVGCIVLGRGEDEKKVIEWLKTAATVPGFIGFRGRPLELFECDRQSSTQKNDARGSRRRNRRQVRGVGQGVRSGQEINPP